MINFVQSTRIIRRTPRVVIPALMALSIVLAQERAAAVPPPISQPFTDLITGHAGPQDWSILEAGNGTVTQQTSFSNPQGGVYGNVGIQQNGHLQGSGPQIHGDLYLGNHGSGQFSGGYANNRPVTGTVHLGTSATVGPNSYSFTTVSDNPQVFLTTAINAATAASNHANALTPTSGLQNINLSHINLTLTPGVYKLSNFILDHATLTLSGSGYYVFNISNTMKLSSGKVLLANGATASNVLFNFTGSHDVAFSGGGNDSVLNGIILAMNAKVNLAPGLVNGEIISGKNISVVSGAIVHGPPPPSVPEGGSTLAMHFMALAAIGGFHWVTVGTRSKRSS